MPRLCGPWCSHLQPSRCLPQLAHSFGPDACAASPPHPPPVPPAVCLTSGLPPALHCPPSTTMLPTFLSYSKTEGLFTLLCLQVSCWGFFAASLLFFTEPTIFCGAHLNLQFLWKSHNHEFSRFLLITSISSPQKYSFILISEAS